MSISLRYQLWCWRKYFYEPDLRIAARCVARAIGPDARCLDIGANAGAYSYFLAKTGVTVEAFEPIPELAESLRTRFGESINVHQYAVSDADGEAVIHVPIHSGVPTYGFASIEKVFDAEACISVRTRAIDSFSFNNVIFLKIDVEGHELAVLQGAEKMLATNRPIILVEAEERHRANAVESVASFLRARRYLGYFNAGRMLPIKEFPKYARNDVTSKRYICNFFFVPEENSRSESWLQR